LYKLKGTCINLFRSFLVFTSVISIFFLVIIQKSTPTSRNKNLLNQIKTSAPKKKLTLIFIFQEETISFWQKARNIKGEILIRYFSV
jgi:hypothetical protein